MIEIINKRRYFNQNSRKKLTIDKFVFVKAKHNSIKRPFS